ncbi:MAG: cell division protein ZapA [bacterium]
MEQNKIEVEIFGATYTIKSDENPTYTAELAQFVDEKMRNITQKTDTVSTGKIAILAALHIADELFKLKKTIDFKLDRLTRKIDAKLKQIPEK